MRNSSNSRNGKKIDNQYVKYPIEGKLPEWEMEGFVQKYDPMEKYECDYVRFCVDNPNDGIYRGGTQYTVFSITVPWDVAEVDPGDRLRIKGTIRCWKKDSDKMTIELVATSVQEVTSRDDQTATRG